MKGKNTLKLNTETMHEALQLWIDSALAKKPRVVAVRQIQPQTYPEPGQPGYYEIDVDDGEKDAKDAKQSTAFQQNNIRGAGLPDQTPVRGNG